MCLVGVVVRTYIDLIIYVHNMHLLCNTIIQDT